MAPVCTALIFSLIGLANCAHSQPSIAVDCSPTATFADGLTPRTIHHVATTGDDATGDGTAEHPYRSIGRAAARITPGTAIQVHAGVYSGGIYLRALRGETNAPIWIVGAPGEPRPVIRGGNQGIYISRPRYVVLAHLEIAESNDNGINVDDGEEMANGDAARFVVFRDLDIHDTGLQPSGVPDCLKMAGVNDFFVVDSRFARCGRAENGAVGVNGVGTHRGVVRGNRFRDNGFGGIQFKGASADIQIIGNRFDDIGWRGVNMGGATGGRFFRPPLVASEPNYEAARIEVAANLFVGGETAAAFVGCVDCLFARNTVVDPTRWALRILQETVALDAFAFSPATRGRILDNLFFFERSALSTGEDINVGARTDSATFQIAGNHWYAHDRPAESAPRLPAFGGSQNGSSNGTKPEFVDEANGNYQLRDDPSVGAPAGCVLAP